MIGFLRTSRQKKIAGFFLITLCGSLLAGVGLYFNILQRFENQPWDIRLQALARHEVADKRVKLIIVDQGSLNSRSSENITWPWPREMYVPIIKYLNRAGVRGIAFDMLFTEASSWGVADDKKFADAIHESSVPILLGANPTIFEKNGSQNESLELARKTQSTLQSNTQALKYLDYPSVAHYRSLLLPIPELIEAGARLGGVKGDPDSDGIFRHTHPGFYSGDIPILALPFALMAATEPPQSLPDISRYLDAEDRLTIRFRGANRTFETYTYDAVVQSFLDLEQGKPPLIPFSVFKDSWVFFGVDAPGLLDLRPTPLSERFPGVELNATILDNLLNQSFIRAVPLWVAVLATGLGIAVVVGGILFFTNPVAIVGAALLGFGMMAYGSYFIADQGYWFPIVWPLLAMNFGGIGSLALQYLLEGRQRRFIRNAFRFYVSSSVIDKIVGDPSALSLGGERRELTLFFSDIEGFTTISEKIEPTKLVGLLNSFLTSMTDIIMQQSGTVDKYVGDAIVAFWNAPLAVTDHPERAVIAALECQSKLQALQGEFEREYGVSLKMRIGINTGFVSVGNFGSRERFNYTVIGDAANLASRLEGANKSFGTYILITQSSAAALSPRFVLRRIGAIKVVGRKEAVVAYEPLGVFEKGNIPEWLVTYNKARELFDLGNLEEAKALFATIQEDSASRAYLLRIEKEIEEHRRSPSSWDPVWNLTEK